MNLKEGDEVIVIDRLTNHNFDIGEVVKYTGKGLDNIDYMFESDKNGMWYMRIEEFVVHDLPTATTDVGLTDAGKHYRYGFRLNLTRQDIDNGYVTVNIDPYRISDVYNLSGWREHLIKKALRYTDKGHSLEELFKELRCTIDRAEEIMHESAVPLEQIE